MSINSEDSSDEIVSKDTNIRNELGSGKQRKRSVKSINEIEDDGETVLAKPTGTSATAAITVENDALLSLETLRESPVQWPEKLPGMTDFLTMSDTPIHMPNIESGNGFTSDEVNELLELRSLTPEQLASRINSLHDEIYQLGLKEAKEMTRGKLLGIFRCASKRK